MPVYGELPEAKGLRGHIGYDALEKRVRAVRAKIDATEFTMHGWRFTAALELAEAGCSDAEIQAVTGHRILEMVQKYRRRANQKRLSKCAQQRRERNIDATCFWERGREQATFPTKTRKRNHAQTQ